MRATDMQGHDATGATAAAVMLLAQDFAAKAGTLPSQSYESVYSAGPDHLLAGRCAEEAEAQDTQADIPHSPVNRSVLSRAGRGLATDPAI